MLNLQQLGIDLHADLTRDEGVRLKPYLDTVGKLTIGVGRNLDDTGLSSNEVELLLENDIRSAMTELDREIPWWRKRPHSVQRALVNMTFNLGWPRLSGFKKMLVALESRKFDVAAREALDSKWARQVGDRATRIAALIRDA